MFRPLLRSHRRPPRRGTSFILIVVVMLSLFSAVGTAYAMFAMREAKLSLARKDEQGGGTGAVQKAPDPTDTINRVIGALIYDVGDDGADLTNALRGHSLARSMYGRDASLFLPTVNQPPTTPWNGIGLPHETNAYGDRAQQINHTIMMIGPNTVLLDPEYLGLRPVNAATGAVQPFDPTTRTYFSKAVGYSAPDLKDYFLAQIDPATGEILVPSFHRPWLFGPLDPTNGFPFILAGGPPPTLTPDPNNKWYSATGKFLTLRPRPAEHPLFPRVPPDADGVYRGDVQNWPGGVGVQKNDSIWINPGLPVITLPGNKKVQPLVAPLILPLDGLFNASVHGNIFGGGPHISYQGFGPWEVNLGALLPANEANAIVQARGAPVQRNGANSRRFNPYSTGPLPNSAPVAWGPAAPASMTYPAGNSMRGLPTFTNLQSTNAAEANHPSLFSPTEWPGTALFSNRTFPLGDIKRFHLRYASTPDWYSQSELAPFAPTGLKGTSPFTIANGQLTANPYRLDPAHGIRALVTTASFDLDRPKVVPNFVSRDASNALSYGTGPGGQYKPGVVTPGAYPSPQARGAISDFAASGRWSNAMAAIGSVNLNRPLADYRVNPALALSSPGNVTAASAAQADADRQQLARDIFARLIVALGAAGYVDTDATSALRITLPDPITKTLTLPSGTQVGPFTQQQYDALRYLAQLSVNIVDYIDNDDVITAFQWNRNAAGTTIETVYGHEQSRLVIHEAYSEVTNDPADPPDGQIVGGVQQPPSGPAHVRFWVELLNPTSAQPANGPLGDGSVPLAAYRIAIRRETRTTGAVAPNVDTGAFGSNQFNYLYNNPANATGSFSNTPDALFSLASSAVRVSPNGGLYAPPPANLPANGIVLVGPQVAAKAGSEEFAPNGGVWQNMVQSGVPTAAPGSAAMGYTFPLPALGIITANEFKRHLLSLERLLNPYLPAGGTNTYVSTDLMDYVQSFDAVNRLAGGMTNRNARTAMNANGYDPVAERFSIGKVQPYAGHSLATVTPGAGNYNAYTFPQSMVLKQTTANGGQPNHTFGRHNGATGAQPTVSTYVAGANPTLRDTSAAPPTTETIMLPFDWLVHMDRPLVNQIELFQVRDTPAHLVTDQFVVGTPGVAPGVRYDAGYARWQAIADGIGRGLEYLTIKQHGSGLAHGGRIPGRLNVNAIPDKRVIAGLFDPPAANSNGFDSTYVDKAWTQWMSTRNGLVTRTLASGATVDTVDAYGQSVFDMNSGGVAAPLNRPFMSFGAPAATASATAIAFGGGGNIDQTILRRVNATSPPLLFTGAATSPTYSQAEPVRKMMNNVTQVNHRYLLIMTIGYFEVVGSVQIAPGYTIPQLGPEVHLNIPGDMRAKATAVIDMSSMALKPVYPAFVGDTDPHATEQPFFTSLEQTTYGPTAAPLAGPVTLNIAYSTFIAGATPAQNRLFVAADGGEMEIGFNSKLVLGYGLDQQVATVVGIPGAGQVSVTADSGVFRTAWGGTCVSNVRPGYAGPQPNFSVTDPKYKAVVPYFERLR